MGDPGHRRRDSGERPDGDRRRTDLLRRRRRRVCRGRREQRKAALALQYRAELEGRPDDIHGGRTAVSSAWRRDRRSWRSLWRHAPASPHRLPQAAARAPVRVEGGIAEVLGTDRPGREARKDRGRIRIHRRAGVGSRRDSCMSATRRRTSSRASIRTGASRRCSRSAIPMAARSMRRAGSSRPRASCAPSSRWIRTASTKCSPTSSKARNSTARTI